MKQVYTIGLQEECTIHIGDHVLGDLVTLVAPHNYTKVFIVCDQTTEKLFLPRIVELLQQANIVFATHTIASGESSKSVSVLAEILGDMHEQHMDRKGAVIALGGGVVGDIATVLAGLYYRGIDCIQIPTTLLSQVDSSLGGKGAVDLGVHKNTLGIIRQPRMILIDTSLLTSLPRKQLISGMGEVVKYGIAMDKELFDLLEKETIDTLDIPAVIARCVALKMQFVEKDPMDTTGIRAILNFGHTLGQAIELQTTLTHGEAVAVGMHFATSLSTKTGLLSEDKKEAIIALIKKYELPLTVSGVAREQIVAHMQQDKKTIGKTPQFILLTDIGIATANQTVDDATIAAAIEEIIV